MDLLTLIKSPEHTEEAVAQLVDLLKPYARNLKYVDIDLIARSITDSRYDSMREEDILEMALLNARPHIAKHYHYSTFCARIYNDIKIIADVHFVLNVDHSCPEPELLTRGLRHAKRLGMLDIRLLDGRFDLDALEAVIVPDRSHTFDILAASTLYDRYFMHDQGRRFETIQTLWMRIAMGTAVLEDDPTKWAIIFYNLLSTTDYMASTPTLFNAGTKRTQLSSCYLTSVPDDLFGIYGAMRDNAMLSKWAGGLGNDWSRVRALNAYINGTNGKSQGTVPFLKVANDTAVAVNQGGKRKGACCAYLTTWHLDIEEFVELRKNTGDERRRTHDMNTANWIPDEFMIRVFNDQTWTLFTPDETPELNELYGSAFSEKYKYYEENAKVLGLLHKVVNAKDLWRKMLSMVFETGHPWITFKDVCNIRSPQGHVGIVRSSNLCCIAADQRVVTDQGLVTIAELYANQRTPIIAGRGHTAQASNMLLPRPDAPMVKIHTQEGYTHKVTPDHRVWVVGKGIVEAQHLVAGDKVELQQYGLYGEFDNIDQAVKLGRAFANGDAIPEEIWKGTFEVQRAFTATVAAAYSQLDKPTLEQLQILYINQGVFVDISNASKLADCIVNEVPAATFTHLEELPNEDAYCLTVDSEDHAWTVNGFITHNTEITLNTSDEEIAVCNLGSINLAQHIVDGELDLVKLEKTITAAVRMLDNVIDVNYYPVPQAELSNKRHRPIGLGIMGFQDALYKQHIPYNSDEAVAFADRSMEYISYFAISASADLAAERGAYPTFEGSTWSKGLVPLDTIELVRAQRPEGMMNMNTDSLIGYEGWDKLRARVKLGMRNSNVMAIAPTATISNICGVSQSIEPTFENLYVKSNLSGEFTVINRYLIDELSKLDLWNEETAFAIKTNEGSVQKLDFIPADIRAMFLTAFEMNPKYLVLSAARRQKWIDQAQSLNLYIAQANGKKLDMVYKLAWLEGLKTTYYLRAKGATSAEKSTGATHLNSVSAGSTPEFSVAAPVPQACGIDNPDCEACQ